VKSDGPGLGSAFTIHLPMNDRLASLMQAPHSGGAADVARQRILLIEDNRDSAESACLLLREEGHEVHIAYNGQEGLDAAQAMQPSVILCDIGLPGMDGYQIAREIRRDQRLNSTLLVALTGYGRDEDQRLALAVGFDFHLTKPIDYAVLRRTMAHWALSAVKKGQG
jgi:two-component system CheB/CheR fusion protein